jgi:hypothetical protein
MALKSKGAICTGSSIPSLTNQTPPSAIRSYNSWRASQTQDGRFPMLKSPAVMSSVAIVDIEVAEMGGGGPGAM